jgi:hypothetical protein
MQDKKGSLDKLENSSEALPSKLSKEDLLALFPKMGYEAVYSDAQSSNLSARVLLYYTYKKVLLFPPCTDNPNNHSQFNGVFESVNRAFGERRELLHTKDWLLFPIFEEWNLFLPGTSRKSWVLLAYSRAENQFYLLDPTGPKRAFFYKDNLKYLNQALQNTFVAPFHSGWKTFEPTYLNLQPLNDSSSSEFWVAYFIERLTSDGNLAELLELSTRKPLMLVQDVKIVLSQLSSSQTYESRPIENISPIHSVSSVVYVLGDVPKIEKQNYGVPVENFSFDSVRSLLSYGANQPILASGEGGGHQQQSHGFRLNFYSILIFTGAASSLVALLCLAASSPIISATATTGVLVVGMALFVAGALGKCGLFGGVKPTHRDEEILAGIVSNPGGTL